MLVLKRKMNECPSVRCINCHELFQELRPKIKQIVITKHFLKDFPGFDVSLITDCKHEYFKELHKFEEIINGNHIFRALKNKIHILYAIDKNYRLIFLRAFKNFNEYKKFLEDKKEIRKVIDNS